MTATSNEDGCREMRELIELRLEREPEALPAADNDKIVEHLSQCRECHRYESDMRDIISGSRALPQFDVAEALTQRILAALDTERKPRESWTGLVAMVVAVALTAAYFVLESSETVAGMGSWAICLVAMAAFRLVVSEPAGFRETGQG